MELAGAQLVRDAPLPEHAKLRTLNAATVPAYLGYLGGYCYITECMAYEIVAAPHSADAVRAGPTLSVTGISLP